MGVRVVSWHAAVHEVLTSVGEITPMMRWWQLVGVRSLLALGIVLALALTSVARFQAGSITDGGGATAQVAAALKMMPPDGGPDSDISRGHVDHDHSHVAFGLPPNGHTVAGRTARPGAWPSLVPGCSRFMRQGPDRPPKTVAV